VLTEREEKSPIAIASNEPFSGWTKTFTAPRLCAAIVDRLTFNGQIIETGTTSYRLAHARATRARKNRPVRSQGGKVLDHERAARGPCRRHVKGHPTACSPQAWAAGTPLLLFRVLLGLEPGPDGVTTDPHLPAAMGRVQLHGVEAPAPRKG